MTPSGALDPPPETLTQSVPDPQNYSDGSTLSIASVEHVVYKLSRLEHDLHAPHNPLSHLAPTNRILTSLTIKEPERGHIDTDMMTVVIREL